MNEVCEIFMKNNLQNYYSEARLEPERQTVHSAFSFINNYFVNDLQRILNFYFVATFTVLTLKYSGVIFERGGERRFIIESV